MSLLTPVAVRVGSLGFMPRLLPAITATDKGLQRVTGGRVSILDVAGLPNLTLTVAGRRSGLARSTPLLAVPRDGHWLVAGSNFGQPSPPVWVVNLEAATTADITVKGTTTTVTPRRLQGEERARAWDDMVAVWPNFRLYAERTEREIKVFQLTPTEDGR